MTTARIAILYQAIDAPVIDGVRKPKKDTGYADSGADIGFTLRRGGFDVITPTSEPDPERDLDWVFPDSHDGIAEALRRGADTLWLNTILFDDHPIESVIGAVRLIGQHPRTVHRFDDKWNANTLLSDHGLPVPTACLIGLDADADTIGVEAVDAGMLAELGLSLPLVLKPLRGRGSKGVTKVDSIADLRDRAHDLLTSTDVVHRTEYPRYGKRLILEEFLPGTEITITVLPPGGLDGDEQHHEHWALPAIERFDQADGVVPYSGDVAVVENSRQIDPATPGLDEALRASARSGDLIGARAPIRVDCRRHDDGTYRMFDLNLKPNMTGAGRPGRDDQDSLSSMAANAYGWTYNDLLGYIAATSWSVGDV